MSTHTMKQIRQMQDQFAAPKGEDLGVARWDAKDEHVNPTGEFVLASDYANLSSRCESLQGENIKLLNDASIWRNRAIAAEEEIREGGRGIDLRRGFER